MIGMMLQKVMTGSFKKIPSGSQLRTFAAAATYENFSEAAESLGVTQAAVSRLVKKTEQQLAFKLFKRSPKGVTLTQHGQHLFDVVNKSFDEITKAIEEIQKDMQGQQVVLLSASSAFVTHWLIPRIGGLAAKHPEIELRFQILSGEPVGELGSADLGVRLEGTCSAVPVINEFAKEAILPVCSPKYYANFNQPEENLFQGGHTLIHFANPRVSWNDFLQMAEMKLPSVSREITFSDYSVVLQAALAGEGVALGWEHIVRQLVDHELLVPAFPAKIETGNFYQLFRNRNANNSDALDKVIGWFSNEMQC